MVRLELTFSLLSKKDDCALTLNTDHLYFSAAKLYPPETFRVSKIFNFFTGNIGYHHIHHLAPKVPFYKLEKCSKENPIFQKYVTTITLLSSVKYAFYTLWDEENYRMITFRQLKTIPVKA